MSKTVADDFLRALVKKHWNVKDDSMHVSHDNRVGHMRFLVETALDPPADEVEDKIRDELQKRYQGAELYIMRYAQ